MFYEANGRGPLPFDPLKALISPRPIGWISSISAAGAVNLAPYSFFQVISQRPGMVLYSSEGPKDSATFSRETGEFVCNMATWDFRHQMLLSSDALPRGESEFRHGGLEMEPSQLIRPPRVKGVAAALECKTVDAFELKDMQGCVTDRVIVIGQVIGVYIRDEFLKDGKVDTAAMQLIARCGYFDYAVIDRLFQMRDHTAKSSPPDT